MVSKQTKRKALTIKKIAEDSNPKRMDNKPMPKRERTELTLTPEL